MLWNTIFSLTLNPQKRKAGIVLMSTDSKSLSLKTLQRRVREQWEGQLVRAHALQTKSIIKKFGMSPILFSGANGTSILPKVVLSRKKQHKEVVTPLREATPWITHIPLRVQSRTH